MTISRRTCAAVAALGAALVCALAGSTAAHAATQPDPPTFSVLFYGAQLNQTTPPVNVTGVDPSASEVTLYDVEDDGSLQADASTNVVAPDGTATILPTLDEGLHSLVVSQTVGGVESDTNQAPVLVNVNTAAPILDDQGAPAVTNDNQPWLHAFVPNNTGAGSATVALYIDGQYEGDFTDGGSDVSFQVPITLSDGAHSIDVATVDSLGHTGATHSNALSITVDTVAPAAPSIVSPRNGSTITDTTPQVVVHAEPGASVSLFVDDGESAEQTADGAGDTTFTLSRALSAGRHTMYVNAQDAAGNPSDYVGATVTVQAQRPVTPTNPNPPAPANPNPPAPTKPQPPVSTTPQTPVHEGPLTLARSVQHRTLRSALARRVHVVVRCLRSCQLSATMTVSKATARKLHLRSRMIGTLRGHGLGRVLLPVRLNARAARALRKGPRTVLVTVTVSDAQGHTVVQHIRLQLKSRKR